MIDHLPRTSHFMNAIAQDDEVAAELAGDDTSKPVVALTDWSPEVEVLSVVADRLADVCNTLIGVNGGKPRRVQPLPRPETAFDRARSARRRAAAIDLERQLFPDLHPPDEPEGA